MPDVTFSLEQYSDADSKEKFRIVKADHQRLKRCLNIPERVVTAERTVYTGIEALYIVLRRFAVSDWWSDLMTMFAGRALPLNIYLRTLDIIYNKLHIPRFQPDSLQVGFL
ncbi:hypothetical protein AaE_011907 [Aphanomyces astaci]|uniref:Uncharacterized protein n=1 Tax=Aphanomyces astaci TaxID=112090 RepID=A0A6A4ZMC7_APHAT|nr:hypothetical protein AaE_011907 [Aphanomyces astaci]